MQNISHKSMTAPISRLYMVIMNLKVKFKLSILIIINYLTCWPGQSAYITFQILVVHRTTRSMPFLMHDHITERYKKCSYTMATHSSGTPLYQLTCVQLGHLPQPVLPVSSLGIFHSQSYLYPAWASSTASLTCIQLGHLPQPVLPVSSLGIFHSQSLELFVHGLVETLPQEEGPEAKHGVHLLWLAHT